MRRLASGFIALALGACAAAPQQPPAPAAAAAPAPAPAPARPAASAAPAVTLRNPGFEAETPPDRSCPIGWDCTMHNNPKAFRFYFAQGNATAGARSVCVERVHDEPWALMTQAFENPQVRGKRLRLSMAVMVEGLSGDGAGPWALVQGNPPVHERKLVRGTAGWQRVAVDIAVPASGLVVEVGATIEGPGKACFDDVRLEILP